MQHGVQDSLSYQSSFIDFQTGLGMDLSDDLIDSALAGGPVTSSRVIREGSVVSVAFARRLLCLLRCLHLIFFLNKRLSTLHP